MKVYQDDGFGNLILVKWDQWEVITRPWFDEHYQYHDF